MTNRIFLWLLALVLCFLAADHLWLDWDVPLFLGRRLVELIEYVAFWR